MSWGKVKGYLLQAKEDAQHFEKSLLLELPQPRVPIPPFSMEKAPEGVHGQKQITCCASPSDQLIVWAFKALHTALVSPRDWPKTYLEFAISPVKALWFPSPF